MGAGTPGAGIPRQAGIDLRHIGVSFPLPAAGLSALPNLQGFGLQQPSTFSISVRLAILHSARLMNVSGRSAGTCTPSITRTPARQDPPGIAEIRTPVYLAVLGPVCDGIRSLPDVELFLHQRGPGTDQTARGSRAVHDASRCGVDALDLYLNGDPWAAARLRRCARRVNFFHGVAGKYHLNRPEGLPMGFQYYDRVAFINADRMHGCSTLASSQRHRRHSSVTKAGSPRVRRGGRRRNPALARLDPARPTALYAPTYSPASSLHLAGEEIVIGLANAEFNVAGEAARPVPHRDKRYTVSINWRARMRALEGRYSVHYVEGPMPHPTSRRLTCW